MSHRITWRVILIMTLFNVFVIGAVFISDLAVSEVESEMRAQYLMDGLHGKLCVMQSAVEIAAMNSMDEFVDNLDSPEKVFDAMEHELRLNKDCVGFGIGFEPDYYPSQGRWFEPYVMFSDSTHVERKQIGSAQHDYFNQEWYVIGRGLAKGQGYMTDPYFDKDGGKCLLSTYVTPVFDRQGRQVAVYGIDLNLNWIKEEMAEVTNPNNETGLLADAIKGADVFIGGICRNIRFNKARRGNFGRSFTRIQAKTT